MGTTSSRLEYWYILVLYTAIWRPHLGETHNVESPYFMVRSSFERIFVDHAGVFARHVGRNYCHGDQT